MQDIDDEMSKPAPKELDIFHYVTDSEIVEQVWCGEKDEVILTLTEDQTVYRSGDQGITW